MSSDTRTLSLSALCRGLEGTGAEFLSINRLLGFAVRNYRDERLGHVEDVIVDPGSGKIGYIVVCSGGWLGIGKTCSFFSWSDLSLDLRSNRLMLNADPEP